MSRKSRASDMLRGMAEYGGEGCIADYVDDLAEDVADTEQVNAQLRAKIRKLEAEIEWRTSESATFRRERDEAREEIAELRKFKDKVRALDRLQQKDWDEPGIELAVQQLEDEIADEVRK